jgi:hypothetical protein
MHRTYSSNLQLVLPLSGEDLPPSQAPKSALNDPQLYEVWCFLQQKYFPYRTDILAYTVRWSSRSQKRTLASCNMVKKHISVARELQDPQWSQWLEPLLYHEMCHAILAPELIPLAKQKRGRTPWHGAQFKALEGRHPRSKLLDQWVRTGGWSKAVRSDRAKRVWQRRKEHL